MRIGTSVMLLLACSTVGCDAVPDASVDLADPGVDDAAVVDPAPGDMAGSKPRDMASLRPPDLALSPITGSVTAKGGKVSRLLFGINGDARPSMCNETFDYPTKVLKSIASRYAAAGVEFAIDTGDHMFVCQNGTQAMADAQMKLYVDNTQLGGGRPTFMTLGNHDCVSMNNPSYCKVGGFETPNFRSFLSAIAPISAQPYYSFTVQTDAGPAVFVIVADNAWSPAQDTWLNSTLASAQQAAYVFVVRHHPLDNTDMPDFQRITQVIKMYKESMVIVGHTHELRLDTFNDRTGRTIIVGNAGAPLATNFTWFGYAVVEQVANGNLVVSYYDESTGNKMGAFTLSAKP